MNSIGCLFKNGDYVLIGEHDTNYNSLDWKKNFKVGLQVKNIWGNITLNKKNFIPNFAEDCLQVCEEFYAVLKEYSSLPKLRKANLYVENDLNTIHQVHLYDFLYDQQDLYDYYNEVFETWKISKGEAINVRKPELTFALALENFDRVFAEFAQNDEGELLELANLRWYICQASLESSESKNKCNNKNEILMNLGGGLNLNLGNASGLSLNECRSNKFPNEDVFSLYSTTYTENYTAKLIEEAQARSPNHLISLLNSLVLSLTYFCRIALQHILKYQHNDHLFLDCFIKRTKAFTESAVYMNEQLENLNVLVNYIYEFFYKDYPNNPKFSIYRLMIITWNREVTTPLCDLNFHQNLLQTTLAIAKKFLKLEINKMYGTDIFFKIQLARGSSLVIKNENQQEFSTANIVDKYEDTLNYICQEQNCYNHSLTSIGIKSESETYAKASVSLFDEVYTFDFQAKYFLEQIPQILLDSICNEYSVFYINDSQFLVSNSYQIYEKNLINIVETLISKNFFKQSKLELARYFKECELINYKMINSTRLKVVHMIAEVILSQSELEMMMIFEDYLRTNAFHPKDAESFVKAYDSTDEKKFYLYPQLNAKAMAAFDSNTLLSTYAAVYFIRELAKNKNQTYQTIEETRQWLAEETSRQEIIDKHVKKENKRRNILLDNNIYHHQIWNFTPNFTFQQMLEIYGFETDTLKHKASEKQDEDMLMLINNNIEDLATYHQTFEEVNVEMVVDNDLRRR